MPQGGKASLDAVWPYFVWAPGAHRRYRTGLGCQVQIEFVEQGQLMGYGLSHPNGGPMLGLRLNPSVPGPPQDLTTSPSACPIRRRSTSSLPG